MINFSSWHKIRFLNHRKEELPIPLRLNDSEKLLKYIEIKTSYHLENPARVFIHPSENLLPPLLVKGDNDCEYLTEIEHALLGKEGPKKQKEKVDDVKNEYNREFTIDVYV